MLSEVIVRNADDHAVEAPLPPRHRIRASRHSPRGAAVGPIKPVWGGRPRPSPLIFSVDSVLSVVKAFKSASIRANPRRKLLTTASRSHSHYAARYSDHLPEGYYPNPRVKWRRQHPHICKERECVGHPGFPRHGLSSHLRRAGRSERKIPVARL
jgi:hypothetical protein